MPTGLDSCSAALRRGVRGDPPRTRRTGGPERRPARPRRTPPHPPAPGAALFPTDSQRVAQRLKFRAKQKGRFARPLKAPL